jgi:diguanylate cyclase
MKGLLNQKYSFWLIAALALLILDIVALNLHLEKVSDLFLYPGTLLALTGSLLRNRNFFFALAIFTYTIGTFWVSLGSYSNFQISNSLAEFLYYLLYPLFLIELFHNQVKIIRATLIGITLMLGVSLVFSEILLLSKSSALLHSLDPFQLTSLAADSVLVITFLIALIRSGRLPQLLGLSGYLAFGQADYFSIISASHPLYAEQLWLIAIFLLASFFLLRPKRKGNFLATDISRPEARSKNFKYSPRVIYLFHSSLLLVSLLLLICLTPSDQKKFTAWHIVLGISVITLVIYEVYKDERELQNLTTYQIDSLTSLPGRRYLLQNAANYLTEEVFAFMMDLNGFKRINDSYGHAVGDQVIVEAAERFKKCISPKDLLVRLGGDEFFLLAYCREKPAVEIAQNIYASLTYPIYLEKYEFSLGVSIGYLSVQDLVTSSMELNLSNVLAGADKAMYRAKRDNLGIAKWHAVLDGIQV